MPFSKNDPTKASEAGRIGSLTRWSKTNKEQRTAAMDVLNEGRHRRYVEQVKAITADLGIAMSDADIEAGADRLQKLHLAKARAAGHAARRARKAERERVKQAEAAKADALKISQTLGELSTVLNRLTELKDAGDTDAAYDLLVKAHAMATGLPAELPKVAE